MKNRFELCVEKNNNIEKITSFDSLLKTNYSNIRIEDKKTNRVFDIVGAYRMLNEMEDSNENSY